MPGRETPVLPGTYDAFVMITPRRNGREQKLPALCGSGVPPITLCATTNVVKLGPPFELKFRASRASNDTGKITVNEAVLVGVSGERYRGQQYFPTEGGWGGATSLTRCLVRRGEEQQHLLKLEYG